MKNIFKKFAVCLILALAFSTGVNHVDAATRVRGYTTKRGTYVAPHYRSNSNSRKYDNYSSRGNYNPYTGKKGYKSF